MAKIVSRISQLRWLRVNSRNHLCGECHLVSTAAGRNKMQVLSCCTLRGKKDGSPEYRCYHFRGGLISQEQEVPRVRAKIGSRWTDILDYAVRGVKTKRLEGNPLLSPSALENAINAG